MAQLLLFSQSMYVFMKKIWITGASSGIGKALALKFAQEGWQVAASARRESLLNEISELNKNISPFPLDVNDKEKCKEIFEQVKNKYQNVDICQKKNNFLFM